MYKILKGLSRCRARAPAPTQSSISEDGDISSSLQEDGQNTLLKAKSCDERLKATRDEYTNWHNHHRFEYGHDVRFRYCEEMVVGSATVWAIACFLNDIHHFRKERHKSSYCIWKLFKDKSLRERLGEVCSTVITLPHLTVNSVLPKIPPITLNSKIVHAAGGQETASSSSILSVHVSQGTLYEQVYLLPTKQKKSVSIDPKFISHDAKSSSQTTGHTNVSSCPSLSDSDVDEFVSSTKTCIGLTYNIQGLEMYKNGKFEQAFQSFVLGSNEGCSQAQYNLALCYEKGSGTTQNLKKAKSEYRKAALQGHKWAQYNLALMLLKEHGAVQQAHGMFLLEEAARQGMVEAQSLLGAKLTQKGPFYNMEKAVEMFALASAQEDVLSTYHLAECHEHGLGGLSSSGSRAYELYSIAAGKGHLDSKYKMAAILANGCRGVDKNEAQAEKLFAEAASAGHPASKERCEQIKRDRNKVVFEIGDLNDETERKKQPRENEAAQLLHVFMPEILRNLQMERICEHMRVAPTVGRNHLFGPALLNTALPHGVNFHKASTWPNALADSK